MGHKFNPEAALRGLLKLPSPLNPTEFHKERPPSTQTGRHYFCSQGSNAAIQVQN